MSAREEILAEVRRALGAAAGGQGTGRESSAARRADIGLAGSDLGPDQLLGLFVERVGDYRAEVSRCAEAEVSTTIARALGGAAAVVAPGFPWPVAGGVADCGQSAAELDQFAAVVTSATVGIATTGTIVLDHGPGQGRRALSLVPDLHVCVVRREQVVFGVPQAMERLDPRRPLTWISGPSATSDIELTRVEGVHGPRTLHVIVVG